ncbi:MAG: cysteine desulfurase family protein [Calditrichaceae bacterium]
MSNQIYLDYAATTPLAEEVNKAMYEFGRKDIGNPSSPHRYGQQAKIYIEVARDLIAASLNCKTGEVVFTSGGTESNNLAIIGASYGSDSGKRHIIISGVEHPSVLDTAEFLKKFGYEISIVNPDTDGSLSGKSIAPALRDDTILISVMIVNNETGIIHNIEDISKICRDNQILLHCDGIQAYGKISIDFNKSGIDLLSVSAHKIHGPKGIGALIVKKGTPFSNIHFGGGQEANRRPGTENLGGIVGFGEAIKLLSGNAAKTEAVHKLQEYFENNLKSAVPGTNIIGAGIKRSPYISAIAFPGINNESMLMNLDLAGIAVSVGSACSSGSIQHSHVLQAMNLPEEIIKSAVRFSYGRYTKLEELKRTINTIKKITERLI